MLKLIIDPQEYYDEAAERFITLEGLVVVLEHSLASLSKWESKHQIPFLSGGKKSTEQIFDYIKMMIVTPEISPEQFSRFSEQNFAQINDYIESKQSATTFGELPKRKGPSEVISSELIYYWMVAFNVPFECENWHLNRLFALIRICNVKNQKPKKMSRGELNRRNSELNAQRRAALNTTG